jgi:hypothetical protein
MDTFVISVTIVPCLGWLCEYGGRVPKCIRFLSLFSTVWLWNCFFLFACIYQIQVLCVCVCVTANAKYLPAHIHGIYLILCLILSYLTTSCHWRHVISPTAWCCLKWAHCVLPTVAAVLPWVGPWQEPRIILSVRNLYCIKHRVC